MDIALIDSQSQASRAVKHLLQGRDRGCRFIQGHERGVVNFTQNHAMLHHHLILFPPIYRDLTGHFYMFKHISVLQYRRCTSPRGAPILWSLSDEILKLRTEEVWQSALLSLPDFMAAFTSTAETPGPFIFMVQRRLHLV